MPACLRAIVALHDALRHSERQITAIEEATQLAVQSLELGGTGEARRGAAIRGHGFQQPQSLLPLDKKQPLTPLRKGRPARKKLTRQQQAEQQRPAKRGTAAAQRDRALSP
jgi:hypothetical protein